MFDNGATLVVRFAHGIEECEAAQLEIVAAPLQVFDREEWDVPLEVINRLQAEAIVSANDTWGVFSKSRVELLPHQLWVCRQVNERWPTRWLVADDVGLGKTIEAGMILWPLLAKGTVKRVLILAPASLVEQWQYRLRTMFDIRLAIYATTADSARADFWGVHNQVVASFHTLRADTAGRHARLFEADPWDLVIVDEAHHLNADEQHGQTLAYQLVKKLQDAGRVRSLVFFTGTPHRGDDYGFLSLVHLLRPDLFDLRTPMRAQLARLPEVMIRNAKANVTDLKGKKLFRSPSVSSETYQYSEPEAHFYALLTQFIAAGLAYASGLSRNEQRTVMLVLIAMQKLASSSTAAIRRALNRRLEKIAAGERRVDQLQELLAIYSRSDAEGPSDEMAALEEELADAGSAVQLMKDEEPRLRELLAAADQIIGDTKLAKLLEVVKTRFDDRTVLFFTEYKATQGALLSELLRAFGEGAATFINGDDRLDSVRMPDGKLRTLRETKENAAERFRTGDVRFLISTEAGGEGIDLQDRCHTLIHVDLPWNPMRLHQRVGRLNRYGQTQRVDVLTLRNPDTVESLIWDKLNEKLERISLALGQVMDEPEDLLQLVLGMTSPTLFTELFSKGSQQSRESLNQWFDQQTAHFGGVDVVQTVRDLVGNARQFDFQQVSDRLPLADLPDLKPFLEVALALNGRKMQESDGSIGFLTPEPWMGDPAVRREYRNLSFDRTLRTRDAAVRVVGVGHKALDKALEQAASRAASVASVSEADLPKAISAFRIRDRITGQSTGVRAVIVGVEHGEDGALSLMRDWELLVRLNRLPSRRVVMAKPSTPVSDRPVASGAIDAAERFVRERLQTIEHPFQRPDVELLGALLPV
jgi:ERCC4-related helicase